VAGSAVIFSRLEAGSPYHFSKFCCSFHERFAAAKRR